jgi:Skp family chaperone for outer membrane proteins
MKTKLLLAGALIAAIPSVASAQRVPPAAVAVVDAERIYRECNACRTAQAALQTQVQSLQQRQQALGTPIQQEMQSIQQAAQAARNQTGAARTATETQLQQRLQALQQRETAANQELAQAQENLRSTQAHILQQINTRLGPIVNTVRQARGANVVVPAGSVLSYGTELDVTTDVLTALNGQLPSVSVTPLPQQPGQQQPQQQQQPPRPGRR